MLDQSSRAAILKLREQGHSIRNIARALKRSRSAVRDVLRSATESVPTLVREEKATPYQRGLYATAYERKADDCKRDGPSGRACKSERLQQGTASGMGEARWTARIAGWEGRCLTAKAAEQQSDRVCRDPRRVGPHYRTNRRPDEQGRQCTVAEL
jgi:Homeodomain-like domain